MKNFYITTTLPYVNAEPHIGFAMELIRADIIARAKRLQGYEVFFNTGTDEHGSKIYKIAIEKRISPQEYVDGISQVFAKLATTLNVATDVPGITYNFVRTTDVRHQASAQAFWQRCVEAGDIYKKNYSIKYCVGCELEKTESELVDGKCPLHPNLEIEIREEENYFFRFSKYQAYLLDVYAHNPQFVIPPSRGVEIRTFVEGGLQDFSISRLTSKMPWGVPVPGDPEQTMYVWFDALVNYISVIGWPDNLETFDIWWKQTGGAVQYAGKDNLRQQTAMWQAMLASAGLPPSKQVVINGFINAEGGVKMSKSLGNTVNPFDIVGEYGVDALRYFMAREISSFEDGVFTIEKFKDAYNANLANGLGNLVARIMRMAEGLKLEEGSLKLGEERSDSEDYVNRLLDVFEINKACDYVWHEIGEMDKYIQENQPFKVVKTDPEAGKQMISQLVVRLYTVARMLNPILPVTSDKIKEAIKKNMMPETLFPRKD